MRGSRYSETNREMVSIERTDERDDESMETTMFIRIGSSMILNFDQHKNKQLQSNKMFTH